MQHLRSRMVKCPRCFHDELYRVHRAASEKILYTQAYECRACGHRLRVARPSLAATKQFCARHLRRRLKSAS
jgi:transposase-like protein